MKLAKVNECDASECAYNHGETCHAMAITIGGGTDHRCDTFFASSTKGGDPDATGAVGACKVSACRHNKSFECSAPFITIGHEATEIDCLTFAPA